MPCVVVVVVVVKCGFLGSEMLIVVTRAATGTSHFHTHPVSRSGGGGRHLPRDILHNVTTFYERPAAFCRATLRSQFNHSSVLVIEARRWSGCRMLGKRTRAIISRSESLARARVHVRTTITVHRLDMSRVASHGKSIGNDPSTTRRTHIRFFRDSRTSMKI